MGQNFMSQKPEDNRHTFTLLQQGSDDGFILDGIQRAGGVHHPAPYCQLLHTSHCDPDLQPDRQREELKTHTLLQQTHAETLFCFFQVWGPPGLHFGAYSVLPVYASLFRKFGIYFHCFADYTQIDLPLNHKYIGFLAPLLQCLEKIKA